MMKFKELTLEDKPALDRYLTTSARLHCDYSFAGMYCWNHVYRHCWCIADGFLILKVKYKDGHIEYRQPIGDGDFQNLIPLLQQDAAKEGQELILSGLTTEGIAICREALNDYGFAQDRSRADYIYKTINLRELHGKRYQAKRNFINKFNSEYEYKYLELTPELYQDCLQLESRWQNLRKQHISEADENLMDEELADERQAIQTAFEHWEELGFYGGAIYVAGKMIAFAAGAPIDENLFCMHIEKADTAYDGSFALINNEFVKHLPPQYTEIDMEDDVGLPGLRKSKLSYCPEYLSPVRIGKKLTKEMLEVRDLWLSSFPSDTIDDADAFLLSRYKSENLLCKTENGQIVSMAHIIPFGNIAYLYAVATAPLCRHRGYAGELCREAIERCKGRFEALILIPANDSLREWYSTMGFSGEYPIRFENADDFDFGTGDAKLDKAMVLPLNPSFVCPLQLEL